MNVMQFMKALSYFYGPYATRALEQEVRLHIESIDQAEELYEICSHLKKRAKRDPLYDVDIFDIETARAQIRTSQPISGPGLNSAKTEYARPPAENHGFMTAVRQKIKDNRGSEPEDIDSIFTTCPNGHTFYGSTCRQCVHNKNGTEE